MFKNLSDVRRFLSTKDIKRVLRHRLSGKYAISLLDAEVDVFIGTSGCEVIIVQNHHIEERFKVDRFGEKLLTSFLDEKVLELMT